MESNEELKATLNAIFKINEKAAFLSEYQNLLYEIESKGMGEVRIFIQVNFVLYKLYCIDEFNRRRLEIINDPYIKLRIPHLMQKITSEFNDDYFYQHKKFLLDVLVDLIVSLDEFNEELFRSVLYNQNQDVANYLMEKTKMKKEMTNQMKYESTFKNHSKSTNFETNNRDKGYVAYKDSPFSNFCFQKCNQEIEVKEYHCEISYLGGNDLRTQIVVIKSKVDYNTFLFNLKKKLDIYEHAKFKILIFEEKAKVFKNINQLKINDTNRLKIVPYEF
jgi:hypothetical protein